MATTTDVIKALKSKAGRGIIEGRERFGIYGTESIGVSQPDIRTVAKQFGRNHALALELWSTGIHEARHVASIIADPGQISDSLLKKWLKDFNSWDIVDGCCSNYFRFSPNAYKLAKEWTNQKGEFQKRAGFALMCSLAVHDKKAADEQFEDFFDYIYEHSGDERNFVRKAVNWALRQIGKRNERLCRKAIALAKKIRVKEDKTSKWIAADALRELEKYLASGKIKKTDQSRIT